ncbi:AraC family transcriptional regulator [Botrimarina hoheduenensis]|uniref:HTH-type transcriptional regulator ChbR n=1 Tax=Botrimarina hoheduenensis TaxID=2528000 RepID=A0A5C5WBT1_9BACT|nr:AraC family transcriptional regulator [Botrimarina hoheduenensis]TWT47555.1 HTH-type transcriptional regulator ChbR [Botrimarina hoheduenensis]
MPNIDLTELGRSSAATEPEFFSRKVLSARRYFLDLSPPAGTALAVVSGGDEKCAPDYFIQRANFPHYVIEWVARGTGEVQISSQSFTVQAGSVYCYGPGIPHTIRTHPEKPLRKHFVAFTGTEAARLCAEAGLPPGTHRALGNESRLEWTFDALRRDAAADARVAAPLCQALLRYLCAVLANAPASPPAASVGAYDTFMRCERHLNKHALRITSLGQLAEECGVAEAYLCRLYQRFGQGTPYQRLLRLRMNFAAEQLSADDRKISDIAREVGYPDPFHFSRTFKSVFGVSPSQFRRLR